MKKGFVVISLLFVLVSCLKDSDYHAYKVSLTVDFGSDFPLENKAGAKVTLFNQLKNYTCQAETDKNGAVSFFSVEPGFYSITVTHSIKMGISNYMYNGLADIQVFGDVSGMVKVNASISNPFVIKEIYYSGSTTPAGKIYYADQFLEIFNNTSEVQYADGISVLEHESNGTEVNIWGNIKDTIVAEYIWTIPGTGTQVPVRPGESIIIAQDGINHKDDPKGNPLSPVNLGNADFEFYVYKYNNKDVDSPLVPNMIRDYFWNSMLEEVTFRVQGGSSIAIAKLPGSSEMERRAYILRNLISKPFSSGSDTTHYVKVANRYLIDAVETVEDEAHAIYKRFSPDLDAGYTYVPSGSRSGKCVRRKIKEVVSGRVIYQDTNNSTNDFLKDVDPKPKVYE